MTVRYGNINLTPSAVEPAAGLSTAIQRSVQVGEAARVGHVAVIPRGNRTLSLAFTVQRLFNTPAEAENFILDHEGELPDQADLILNERRFPGACLESVSFGQLGSSIPVQYRFIAGGQQAAA